jgi:hypothetical protein
VVSVRVELHAPGYQPPPAVLVDDRRQRLGRFDGPPGRANLIDARYHGLPRPLRWLRLKEWQAFQIASPRWFVNVALFDAKLMSLLQVKIYDRERGDKHVHERKLRPGAFKLADQLLDSSNRYQGHFGSLGFDNRFAQGQIDIELDLPARKDCPAMSARLAVHTARGASQVVSLPFSGNVGMYSHKGMFPIDGTLTVGDDHHTLAPGDALALMDDHKGYYPYVMKWDWVTSATRDAAGRALGINLTANQCRDPERWNENCGWIDDRIGRLPAVTFEREHAREPGERWRIRDRDGRVDVTFEPTVPGDVKVNAVVVESRYRGPFGTLSGRVEPEGLAPISVDGWFGMGEEFWLRC